MSKLEVYDTIKTRNLCLVDRNDIERVLLSADDGSPTIELLDSQGRMRVELTLEKYGRTYLSIFGEDGAPRIDINVTREGHPSFHMYDTNGDILWSKP